MHLINVNATLVGIRLGNMVLMIEVIGDPLVAVGCYSGQILGQLEYILNGR